MSLATTAGTRLDRLMDGLRTKARAGGFALPLCCLALLLLASAVTGEQGLFGAWELEREVADAERMNFELVQKISETREEIHAIENDDATLERVARRQAHLVRPGETLYRLDSAQR